MQYTYEWTEELVLEELEVFLSVWRTVTPNLQVVEVWLDRDCGRWERKKVVQLQMMCEEAGVSCNVHLQMECDALWRMEACSVPMWAMQGPWPRKEKALPTVEHIHPIRIIDRSMQTYRTQLPSRTERVKYYTHETNGRKTYVKEKTIGDF